MFTIQTDPRCRLIRITLCGMLTVADVKELYRQEHAAILAMGCPLGEQLVLVDLSECPLQLQDIVAAFQQAMNSSAKAKRLALVTGSSLARMQARRITSRADAALFETEDEALAWLFDRGENQRAA